MLMQTEQNLKRFHTFIPCASQTRLSPDSLRGVARESSHSFSLRHQAPKLGECCPLAFSLPISQNLEKERSKTTYWIACDWGIRTRYEREVQSAVSSSVEVAARPGMIQGRTETRPKSSHIFNLASAFMCVFRGLGQGLSEMTIHAAPRRLRERTIRHQEQELADW
jgi:hypothetical protein